MNTFDISSCPMNGTILIEASAGTGKTYTITELYLRLIAEKSLTTDQILVVTFTEAATQELKDRIRTKLREASLRKEYSHHETERLNAAIRDFDESAIFTIHSFCRRMLHEYAFESGSLFDTELLTNQEHIRLEMVQDFWRRQFYGASRLFVNYATERIDIDKLLNLLKNILHYPDIRIVPEIADEKSSDSEEAAYKAAFDAVRKVWRSAKSDIVSILANHKSLNRNKYRVASIPKWTDSMDEMMRLGSDFPFLSDGFDKFTADTLSAAVKSNFSAPHHEFFDLCNHLKQKQNELEAVFEQRLLRLKINLFRHARQEMKRKKQTLNIRSFDDLLTDMYEALEGEHGDILAEHIRNKYKAALIDEFQDTDPIQYAIFKKIFAKSDHPLFLIGDPKQAIYAFRGADVFAYMDAAEHADAGFTLEQNWRSDPLLVQAVNTVFENHPNPFIYEDIRFQAIRAAQQNPSESPPLTLWLAPASDKAMTKSAANRLIPASVAAEISEVLKNREAVPGDIAVLVLRHREASSIQEELSELRIPSVLYTTDNLFDSDEAAETERVLAAIAEPHSERRILSALASDMMGISGEESERFRLDESLWEDRLIRFREYHDLWRRRGFIRMFNEMLRVENVLPRLIGLANGERRITNILHLSEVLHQAGIEKKLSMTGLVKWLSQQRDPATQRLEEHQLRLESDDHAVRIVTVHKSKGLEYPIVFCPFMWNDFDLGKEIFLFHDQSDNRRITLDIGSGNESYRKCAETERRAENLRLLYVALTRAKHRCYLVCGWFHKCEASGMNYLLHHDKAPSFEQISEDLKTIESKASESIRLCEMPSEKGKSYQPVSTDIPELRHRTFRAKIDRSFRISSFSSLTSQQPHSAEIPDYDESRSEREASAPIIVETSPNPHSIHRFPKGAKSGIFLHDLFEHLDFTSELPVIEALVSEKLHAYGFEDHWHAAVVETIRNTLSVPLDPERKNMTLSRIKNDTRLNELGFYFPIQTISPKTLVRIFAEYSHHEVISDFPDQMEHLNFSSVRGFMKGFIDMVFEFEGQYYLLDWKSNFLGERTEDYHSSALSRAMREDFYILQYHLYVLALHQYLKLRIPDYRYERHFGGVFYLFLRGIHPEFPQFGIFRDKPEEALIHQLCEKLIFSPEGHPKRLL